MTSTINHEQTLLDGSLKCTQKDPVSLRHIFLLLTRNHFSNPDNFGDVPEVFRRYTYSDKESDRKVTIDLSFNYARKDQGKTPSVYVNVGDFTFNRDRHADFSRYNSDMSGRVGSNQCTVPITISHLGITGDEALMMGTVTTAFYLGITNVLVEKLGLLQFSVKQLSQIRPKEIQSGLTMFESVLSMELTFEVNWETYTESHKIKNISYEIPEL